MWIALVLILMSYCIIYATYKKIRGTVVAVVFMVVAIGLATSGAYFSTQYNPIQHPAITITTPTGNVIVPSFSELYQPTKQNQGFLLILAEANILIEFGLALYIVGAIFYDSRERKLKRYDSLSE